MASTLRRALVVGGGPAGAVCAFNLGKAGFDVTVAERSTDKFTYGQGIDITGPAVEVVYRMGLLEKIKSNETDEGGFAILDDKSQTVAALGTAGDEEGGSLSLTQEIEILRGTLTKILADAADELPNVRYRYGCTVSEIRQSEKYATAVLTDTNKAEDFAFIIGCDGVGSRVRKLTWSAEDNKNCYRKFIDQYCGFFSMKGEPEDAPNSRWQHADLGRTILIRPLNVKDTSKVSCYMIQTNKSDKLESVLGKSVEDQKAALVEAYADFPGRFGERARQGLKDATDFYFAQTAQVKLDHWSQGRCVLTGDAAYAPSGNTGQGTTLAILGSYVLAGEIASSKDDPQAAFKKYEERLREYVERLQTIPLDGKAPKLLNPRTHWGITILRTIFWLVAWTGVWKVLNVQQGKQFDLPRYTFAQD